MIVDNVAMSPNNNIIIIQLIEATTITVALDEFCEVDLPGEY